MLMMQYLRASAQRHTERGGGVGGGGGGAESRDAAEVNDRPVVCVVRCPGQGHKVMRQGRSAREGSGGGES